jgi:hypothetical protein
LARNSCLKRSWDAGAQILHADYSVAGSGDTNRQAGADGNGFTRCTELLAGFVLTAALFENLNESIVNRFRQRLRIHALVNLNRLFGGIADHPAIWAFADVAFQILAHGGIDILVEKVAQFPKEVFTRNQESDPLSA